MATTAPARDASDPRPDRAREPADRRAVRGRHPPRRGPHRGRGPARRPDRASTPAARPTTSSSSTSPRAATRSGGARSTGRSARRTTTGCGRDCGYCADRDLYAQDCFIGAAPAHRRSLRVYTETAWASIFARNLFRRPTPAQLRPFDPNFTIIASRRSRPTRRPRGPAAGRRSSSTSSGWRSSSSAPSTPARSRRAPSRS